MVLLNVQSLMDSLVSNQLPNPMANMDNANTPILIAGKRTCSTNGP